MLYNDGAMDLIDILIIVLIVGALYRGQELGFVRQLFSTVGFFSGLLIGALLEPHIVGLVHTPMSRLILTLAVTLGLALILLSVGEFIGVLIKKRLQISHGLNRVDNSFGAGLAGISILALAWLSAAILVTLPYQNVQDNIRGSKIISLLDQNLPPAPNVIADIGHLIAPDGFPKVFIGQEPAPSTATPPTPAALAAAAGSGAGEFLPGTIGAIAADVDPTKAAEPSVAAKMIDIAQIQGQVHAQSVQKVGELADKNPRETVSIIRSWLNESAAA